MADFQKMFLNFCPVIQNKTQNPRIFYGNYTIYKVKCNTRKSLLDILSKKTISKKRFPGVFCANYRGGGATLSRIISWGARFMVKAICFSLLCMLSKSIIVANLPISWAG